MSTPLTQVSVQCNRFHGTHVNTVDTTTCIYLLSRLVKEITYREYRRLQSKCITPPTITNKEYKKGMYVVCPLRWQRSALECLHEGAETYMVSLLEDTNLLAIHARWITLQPRDIQLAQRIRGNQIGIKLILLVRLVGVVKFVQIVNCFIIF